MKRRVAAAVLALGLGGCSTLDSKSCGPEDHVTKAIATPFMFAGWVTGLNGLYGGYGPAGPMWDCETKTYIEPVAQP